MSDLKHRVNTYLAEMAAGNMRHFDELFKTVYRRLFCVAAARLTEKSLADDAVMETFGRVFKSIGRFDRNNNGYGWLCRIAANVAYDYNVKYNAYTVPLDDVMDEPYCDKYLGYDLGDRYETAFDIGRAIGSLGSDDKRLFEYCAVEDRVYKDASREFGISIPTVSYRMKRINGSLKKILSDGSAR